VRSSTIISHIKAYLQLLRVHHYIKNILIFIPLFFSSGIFNIHIFVVSCFGFIVFSVIASIVYILNDIKDIEKDRMHNTKRLRPLASGKIPANHAFVIILILSVTSIVFIILLGNFEKSLNTWFSTGILIVYLALNIGYSWGLKNIPLVDITILASGYVIRVLFGAFIIGVDISIWLYLVIIAGSYYLGLGKRRNEIAGMTGEMSAKTRSVLRFYSHDFLDKNMYVCQALCVIFYALWSIDASTTRKLSNSFVYTIPLVLIIFFKYSLDIETSSDGDPTFIVLHDKILLSLIAVYLAWAFCIIYLNRVIV
jgi:4-hydroxybenzoate polyprenyltransferase